MARITMNIPGALSDLPDEERNLLLSRAVRTATKERIEQLEQELKECAERIGELSGKYNMSFDVFERKMETQEFFGVDYQEDYHDWCFWRESKQRVEDVLRTLRPSMMVNKGSSSP